MPYDALNEHDRNLLCDKAAATRFFDWLAPVPGVNAPITREQFFGWDPRPKRSAFTFHTADDVVVNGKRRNDPALKKTLRGSIDETQHILAALNIERRASVFVELSAAKIVRAEIPHGMVMPAWPEPSISIHTSAGPRYATEAASARGEWTVLWLLQDKLSGAQRAELCEKVTQYGATADAAESTFQVRVPGFFNRQRVPFMIRAQGSQISCGQEVKRYSAPRAHDRLRRQGAQGDADERIASAAAEAGALSAVWGAFVMASSRTSPEPELDQVASLELEIDQIANVLRQRGHGEGVTCS